MELTAEVAHYVVRFYGHLMTDTERRAQRHLFATMKAAKGRTDLSAQREAYKSKAHSQGLSNEPEVLGLASDGHEGFEMRTAQRILREYADQVLFNCCPSCGELARTPKAKQCHACAYDWHDEK